MDYKKHYDFLMEKANNRELPKDVYSEKHHILPKCLGGNNNKENVVKLLPKEHYVAHLLLFRLHPNKQKLAFAFWMMCNGNRKKNRKYVVSGKIYEEIRTKFIECLQTDATINTAEYRDATINYVLKKLRIFFDVKLYGKAKTEYKISNLANCFF